jgi:ABC-2 type transport system ATP-binding protein
MPPGFPLSRSDYAIETRQLRKQFGERTAVKDLSLTVNRGEIFGFLGPNGAGKSTSIKMLLGLVHPSGGSAFLLGAPVGDVGVRRRVGFLPEDFRFYDWLTATELLELHGRLAGMSATAAAGRAPFVLDLVGMTPHATRRLRGFSKGMLQRLGLAQALIHEPEIVFLDEPTSGLDPMGRRMVRDVIRAQRDRGATVFLNSHLLSEVEVTCDRVAFIKDGEVIASQDLRDASAARTRRLRVRADALGPAAVGALSTLADSIAIDGDALHCEIESEDVVPQIVERLVSADVHIYEVAHDPTSLEDTFMRLVGEDRGL